MFVHIWGYCALEGYGKREELHLGWGCPQPELSPEREVILLYGSQPGLHRYQCAPAVWKEILEDEKPRGSVSRMCELNIPPSPPQKNLKIYFLMIHFGIPKTVSYLSYNRTYEPIKKRQKQVCARSSNSTSHIFIVSAIQSHFPGHFKENCEEFYPVETSDQVQDKS